jgi:hypothetical protein
LPIGTCNYELGIYGTESPLKLLELMAKQMKINEGSLDAIVINGDFIKHDVALDPHFEHDIGTE